MFTCCLAQVELFLSCVAFRLIETIKQVAVDRWAIVILSWQRKQERTHSVLGKEEDMQEPQIIIRLLQGDQDQHQRRSLSHRSPALIPVRRYTR